MSTPNLQILDTAPKLIIINQDYQLLLVNDQGLPGPDVSIIGLISGTNLNARDLAYVGEDGKAYKASADLAYLRDTPLITFGFVVLSAISGGGVQLKTTGLFPYPGLNIGKVYYMSLAGGLTDIVPETGLLQSVGTVDVNNNLVIAFGPSVTLR